MHASGTARSEKKVPCVVTRICEYFTRGVLSITSRWQGRIVTDQLPTLLTFAVPYSREYIDRETSNLQVPGEIE